ALQPKKGCPHVMTSATPPGARSHRPHSLLTTAVSTLAVAGLALTSGAIGAAAAQAAPPEAIRAAAYLGAQSLAETSLPAEVPDVAGTTEWAVGGDQFSAPCSTVEGTGAA